MIPKKETMICLPFTSTRGFTPATMQSVMMWQAHTRDRKVTVKYYGDLTIVRARGYACEAALKAGVEQLMMVDSDMDFPPDILEKLEACDADIACPQMWTRNMPSRMAAAQMAPVEGEPNGYSVKYLTLPQSGIVDADLVGMACTLIQAPLLKKIQESGEPFFSDVYGGEDFEFCMRAKRVANATIRVNMDVISGHWGLMRMSGQPWSLEDPNY
jgi:hypothetical protein